MRALVMAAGLGTRLKPLTNNCPKPLVPVLGKPMIEYVLELLAKHGIQEAMVNIHYLPEQMRAFVDKWNKAGAAPKLFIQDESKEILGSGGAVALAANWLFEKESTALICNSDVISDPDLKEMFSFHRKMQPAAELTMSLVSIPEAGVKYNGVKKMGDHVIGFEQEGVHREDLFHFPGYYLVEKRAVARMPTAGKSFSVVSELWKKIIPEKKMFAWVYPQKYFDLGTPEDLKEAEVFLKNK